MKFFIHRLMVILPGHQRKMEEEKKRLEMTVVELASKQAIINRAPMKHRNTGKDYKKMLLTFKRERLNTRML